MNQTKLLDQPELKPLVYTVAEACDVLKVSNWSIYKLIRSNELHTIKIGRRRLVPVEALQKWIADQGGNGAW